MHSVILGNTGICTSALGFGCSGLMRQESEQEKFALLSAAMESGIRHFDVARYYGHGEAEGVLGRFLKDRKLRDDVTFTTKFGLEPTVISGSSGGKVLMHFARRAAALNPLIHKALSRFANRQVRTGCFHPESARRSLETSLRELQTDRIDILLLHEVKAEDLDTPGLWEFLLNMKAEGKIRAFGLGSNFQSTLNILGKTPEYGEIVQIPNSVGEWNIAALPEFSAGGLLTHGALKRLKDLQHAMQTQPLVMGSGAITASELAGWLLGLALQSNPTGVTLFSTTNRARITKNVADAAAHRDVPPSEWDAFRQAAERLLSV